jgi:predicted acyl esterase
MPLEYFAGTVSWLKTQPMANGDKISVMGALKGSELALLLGAIYPENVKAVVGSVPRVVVRQEISFGRPSRQPGCCGRWEANSSRERKPSSLNERAQGAERTLGYLGGQWSALPLI